MGPALEAGGDPVAGVRMRCAALLPALKRTLLAGLEDADLLTRLRACSAALLADAQPDVAAAARSASDALARTPVSFAPAATFFAYILCRCITEQPLLLLL
jgi:hypothetical protein